MAIQKLTTDWAQKQYDKGTYHTRAAMRDDASYELAQAGNHYAAASVDLLVRLVGGMNDLLERIDRIEQQLLGRRPGGLPF